jgi:hypothetical protein
VDLARIDNMSVGTARPDTSLPRNQALLSTYCRIIKINV